MAKAKTMAKKKAGAKKRTLSKKTALAAIKSPKTPEPLKQGLTKLAKKRGWL